LEEEIEYSDAESPNHISNATAALFFRMLAAAAAATSAKV
jgi:hypothetical protein